VGLAIDAEDVVEEEVEDVDVVMAKEVEEEVEDVDVEEELVEENQRTRKLGFLAQNLVDWLLKEKLLLSRTSSFTHFRSKSTKLLTTF
jgi:hypothetical protein